jgi:LacI family transcriptional regulator
LYALRRAEAFTQYVQEQGFQCQTHQMKLPSWLQAPSWVEDWETEQPILVDWLKSLPKPVGLMTCDDTCGRQVLESCTVAGLRVPDDVAVVGVGNDELMCELCNPPLTSVAMDLEKVGYESARLLDRLMSGQLNGENCVHVQPVYVATRRSSDVIAQDDPCVVTAMRFIRDHAGRAIGVQDVVDAAGVSRRTLERRFLRALGRSIASEITQCRMERAKRLLLETNLPSYRVAEGAGFGTVTTYNRTFRRVAGFSPRRYRENGQSSVSFQKGRLRTADLVKS